MTQLAKIRVFPSAILRKTCRPVEVFDQKLQRLADLMTRTMSSQSAGIGIAAPQIGVNLQVAVVDVSARIPEAQRLILVNPKILTHSDPRPSREGCMSIPDYTAVIARYHTIRVVWQDLKGHYQEKDFNGIEAICIQHEIDHLNGRLFIDRVVSLKRDMIPRPRDSKAK
jgi:peptide deformylase